MNRRQGDDVQRKIDEWERLRADLGSDATHSVIGYISAELDRLRLEKLMRSCPLTGGRRVDDPNRALRSGCAKLDATLRRLHLA